jgi:hypothetical protein
MAASSFDMFPSKKQYCRSPLNRILSEIVGFNVKALFSALCSEGYSKIPVKDNLTHFCKKSHPPKFTNAYDVSRIICILLPFHSRVRIQEVFREIIPYTQCTPQSTHRVATAAFWPTFHHDRKICPEAEFLHVIGTKVLSLFLLAIHSHLY